MYDDDSVLIDLDFFFNSGMQLKINALLFSKGTTLLTRRVSFFI